VRDAWIAVTLRHRIIGSAVRTVCWIVVIRKRVDLSSIRLFRIERVAACKKEDGIGASVVPSKGDFLEAQQTIERAHTVGWHKVDVARS
jgi:hypothetical protein